MRNRAAFRPESPQPLETRAVPASLSLAGVVEGGAAVRSSPRVPTVEHIDAAGTLAGHGAVTVSATLRVGRSGIVVAPVVGMVRVDEAGGSLVLRIRGGRVPGGVGPDVLGYTVVGGTGRDRGARGTGRIALTEAYAPGTLVVRAATLYFNPGPIPLPLNGVVRLLELQARDGYAGSGPYLGRGDAAVPALFREASPQPGPAADTLTLGDAQGTLSLSFAPRADGITDTTYTIVAATGLYAGTAGSGPASVHRGGPLIYGGPFGGPGTLGFRLLVVLGDGGGQSTAPPT